MTSDDDAIAYARRLQAEVEARAAERRRLDPSLEILEREIAQSWENLAPPGATGDVHQVLLDRLENLAHVDVDVPTGSKPGIRQVKRTLRKLNYWYLRYLADQINVVHSLMVRVLRRLDDRVEQIERTLSLDAGELGLVDPIADLSPTAAKAVVAAIGDGKGDRRPIAVVSCAEGAVVKAIEEAGWIAHGVDPDAERILDGVHAGLDLRPGDPAAYLRAASRGSLAALVLAGAVEDLAVGPSIELLSAACDSVAVGGTIVVATLDPSDRNEVDLDLRSGRGLRPRTWAHLLERRGWDVRLQAVDDPTVKLIVVAKRP